MFLIYNSNRQFLYWLAVTPIIATIGWEVGKAVFASEKVFNLLRMRLMCGYVFFLVTCVEIVMYEGRGQNSGEDRGYTARTIHHLQHWLLDSKLQRCSLYNNLTKSNSLKEEYYRIQFCTQIIQQKKDQVTTSMVTFVHATLVLLLIASVNLSCY